MSTARREAVWTAAGWLGVAFGVVGVLVSVGILGLFLLFAIGGLIENAGRSFSLSETLAGLLGLTLVPLLYLLAALLALGAGIGLLRRRHYGRTLTLVFGALSMVPAAFSTIDVWQGVLSHAVNAPPLASRLLGALAFTPVSLGYAIAMALLCRSVYSHREAFNGSGEPSVETSESGVG